MSAQQTPTILIAYPKDFSCYGKFERKVSSILSNLSGYHLAFWVDDREFISRYSSSDSRVLDALLQVDEGQIEEGITHAILFDDGNTYGHLMGNIKKKGIKSRLIDTGRLTRVVNRDKAEEYDVYIGRGSKWGNPYAIGFDGDRDEVIHKFKYDFERDFLKFSREDALELKGKTLGCHCKPAACHGDVLAEYLNSLDDGA